GNGDILNHQLMINAGRFTPVDSGLIPTGELRSVKGTPFDFAQLTAIGARINDPDEHLKFGRGYDHNFVLRGGRGRLRQAAKVFCPSRLQSLWVLLVAQPMPSRSKTPFPMSLVHWLCRQCV